jgi:predicted ester cyclase
MHVEDRIIADDKIVARVTFTATHSRTVLNIDPTGRKISFGTIDIWRVQDGKLAEHWDLVDTVGLQKQLHGG